MGLSGALGWLVGNAIATWRWGASSWLALQCTQAVAKISSGASTGEDTGSPVYMAHDSMHGVGPPYPPPYLPPPDPPLPPPRTSPPYLRLASLDRLLASLDAGGSPRTPLK